MNWFAGFQFLEKIVVFMGICLVAQVLVGNEISGRFAPPAGEILVFAGGNNAAVGGTGNFRDGYADNVGVPGGISHRIRGGESLEKEIDGGASPMDLKAYLDSPTLDRCVIHLSVSWEEEPTDDFIARLVSVVETHLDHPFLINIGPEFDLPGNGPEPDAFQEAFRRIVDRLREKKLPNFAVVFSSSSQVKPGQFERFNPGAHYYDWVGYAWDGGKRDGISALDFARKVKKPVFITRAATGERFANEVDDEIIWKTWFEPFFAHIEANQDVIRAVSYINSDYPVEAAPRLLQKWRNQMNRPGFINSVDKPFDHIGFPAPYAEPEKMEITLHPYQDSTLPVPQRIEDLLGRMTLEEKVAQLTGWWSDDERLLRQEGRIYGDDFYASIAPHGLGFLGPVNLTAEEDIRHHHAVQDYFLRKTRLGIPVLRYSEASHGLMRSEAASFPAPIALASSWNPDLVEKVYSHVGREARSRGIHQLLCPSVGLLLDPRQDRADDIPGEDPFLNARIGSAMVKGLQGSNDGSIEQVRVAATLKHFGGQRYNSGGRRLLLDREIGVFRYIIRESRPAAVMPANDDIDGTPCHTSHWLLREVLKKQIDFKGLVIGGDDAIRSLRDKRKIGSDEADAALLAFKAGVQVELPNARGFQHLARMGGDDQIDEAVRAVLELKFRLGLFEGADLDTNTARVPHSRELALEAARQSIILLKNDSHFLPLDINRKHTIAVIGPNSDVCRLGSYSGTPLQSVSLLEGVRKKVGETAEVLHAKGCLFALNDTEDSYQNWRHVTHVNVAGLDLNRPLIDEAVAVANRADVVILALGETMLPRSDRSDLDLTESQEVLAREVLATGKPVILYLMHGRPLTLGDWGERCKAILTGHYAGQETGTAAAEILFGDTNPSAKLTASWPKNAGSLPVYYHQHRGREIPEAVYPFGHGLNYTSFSYGPPMLSSGTIGPGESVDVVFDLTNTGNRKGTEIAQVYVSGESFNVTRPRLELKGFARVTLEPGETRKVTVTLDADDLHFHDANLKRVLPRGIYKIQVGRSSKHLSGPLTLKTGRETISPPSIPPPPTDSVIHLDMTDSNIRQSIDGFGGLLTFSETPVSDEALEAVINGLNLNLIRARGEVSPSGDPIHNRELLRRAMKLNPDLEVLLTFWQPKSAIHPHREYWLDEVDLDDASVYILKTEREDEWANEIVHRVNLYRDWGVNVTAVSVQNNSNSSRVGTESCRWEPDRLADFVERKIRPGLNAAGLNEVRIAAPELSCLGPKALMIDQYIPVLTSPAVDLAAYHLFADETNAVADLKALIRDTRSTQSLRLQHFPDKGIWMTETMGVPGPSEHDTAINAARCLHTAMVEGEASAFLWGKLIDQDGEESLIVYPSEEGPLVRPKKYYTYRQFSAFVKPGFNRLEVDSPEAVEVSAFVSPDKQRLVSVVINSSESATALNYKAPGNMKLIGTFQTDQSRNCGPVDPASPMPGRSVRTLVYSR